jgi:hypothetical protein
MEVIIHFFLTTQRQVGVVLTRLGDLVFPLDKISCLAALSYFASSAEPNPAVWPMTSAEKTKLEIINKN